MPSLPFHYSQVATDPLRYGPGVSFNALTPEEYAAFKPAMLGLGDLSRDGQYVQALAAFFDLDGFTGFCGQLDSQIVIPEFFTRYLGWLFKALAEELREARTRPPCGCGAACRFTRNSWETACCSSGVARFPLPAYTVFR